MTLKIALRDTAASVLDLVPYRTLAAVRHTYANVKPGSVKGLSCAAALAVLRYRHIDAYMESFALSDAPDVIMSRDNSAITRRLFWYGTRGHEKPVLDLWVSLCRGSRGVLEIGANVGYFTVFGARALASGRYVAVEPHPVSSSLLRRNIGANHLTNVDVIQAAVVGSSPLREVELGVPAADPDGAPAGAYVIGVGDSPEAVRSSLRVPAVPISDLFHDVDLIKIDAEGSECEILTAIQTEFVAARPTLIVEVLHTAQSLRRFLSTLARNADYDISVITGAGLHPISPDGLLHVLLEKQYSSRDVVLMPRERRGALSTSAASGTLVS
jgi:FkbM family methyltransferase